MYACVFLDGFNVHPCIQAQDMYVHTYMVMCETCLWACVYIHVQTQDLCMHTYLDMGY